MADAVFKKYDVDGNGKIDLTEFTRLLTTEYNYDATKAKQIIADEFKVASF
jgi:Ca2+-binding EF-hand superfamily protein